VVGGGFCGEVASGGQEGERRGQEPGSGLGGGEFPITVKCYLAGL
jgi:hypothetical protein